MSSLFLSTTSRDIPLVPDAVGAAVHRRAEFLRPPGRRRNGRRCTEAELAEKIRPVPATLMHEEVLPNMQRLQAACRAAGIEVLYTTIESLTQDGRDRSLDYKITGFNVPKGSWDGKVIDEIAPGEDEIVLPKVVVLGLRLDQYRLHPAQSRRAAAGDLAAW